MAFIFIILSWMILLVPGFDDSVPPTGDKIFKIETSPGIVESIKTTSDEYVDFTGFDIKLKQNSTGSLEIKIPKNLPTLASFTNTWYHDDRPYVLADGFEIGYDIIEDPCYSHYKIPIEGKTNLEIAYAVILAGTWQLYTPVQFDEDNPCYNEVFYKKLDSPLKQFKSGIPNYKITCKEGLKLLIRTNDGPAACVKPDTATELQTRWHKMDSKSNSSEINTMCMTLEKSKDTATFFKVPSYLPDGYSFKCSFSGTPYESYMIFHNKKVPDDLVSNYPQLISDGAIFIHQTDEKSVVGEKKFATYGTAEQRIQETYDSVINGNPSLKPQLIRINGMLAYAVDSCSDCGMQTANFTDGVIIQKTATEAKIKFIDKNGVSYFIKAGIPLNELIKVAESLQ